MTPFSREDFDVDLEKREVRHKESGIRFSFYKYLNEADWERSDNTMFRDNPAWDGDRREPHRTRALYVLGVNPGEAPMIVPIR